MERTILGLRVECVEGDIARQVGFEAVVNAANRELLPGGGVAGAIHRAAGPALAEACRPLAPIRPGEAVLTPGFLLPNPWVVHCLGPVYGRDLPSDALLRRCYESILALAERNGIASLATPALSTGVFGYPLAEAAEVALGTVAAAAPGLTRLRRVRFVLWGDRAREAHERVLARLVG